jgi:hypothetical protein
MAAKQDAAGCGLLNLEFERNRGMGFPKKKLRALMGRVAEPHPWRFFDRRYDFQS